MMTELYNNLIETINPMKALGCMAIMWVIISWIELLIPSDSIIHKYLCKKCSSFWFTLLVTLNPFTAAISAVFAVIFEVIMSHKQTKL